MYIKHPFGKFIYEEIDWYADGEEILLGVICYDYTDEDYSAIVLGRDNDGKYRAIDLDTSIPDQETATEWLENSMKWHIASGKKKFIQGDEQNKAIDLFKDITSIEKQHPGFIALKKDEAYSSAKEIIRELMPHFKDIDGNFVEQFQTSGFDARIWELYLFAYLTEEGFIREVKYYAPDFFVTKGGMALGIEAVTIGRTPENPPKRIIPYRSIPILYNPELKKIMPIRYGSSLFSKMQKKYWELPHLKGLPLIFAIADFYDDFSMVWSGTALINYLYGVDHKWHYDEKGNLIITPEKILKHQLGKKEIQSGFFSQPDNEHISGVLFSAGGTISKFCRMGKLAGFGSQRLKILQIGSVYNHEENAVLPKIFRRVIDSDKCKETWAEGLSLYHNPNALNPIAEELFPSIAHHHFRDGQIVSSIPLFHPYGSITHNFIVNVAKT